MCIFRDRLRNDLRKEKVRNYCVIIARRRERAKQKEERETTSHTNLSLSLSRLPLFCGVVRRKKGSLTQREDYLLRGVGLLQTKREKTCDFRFYIKRKSKRYGLGYQDVKEEEEEEEEELERRR